MKGNQQFDWKRLSLLPVPVLAGLLGFSLARAVSSSRSTERNAAVAPLATVAALPSTSTPSESLEQRLKSCLSGSSAMEGR